MKKTPGEQFEFFQARHGGPPKVRPALIQSPKRTSRPRSVLGSESSNGENRPITTFLASQWLETRVGDYA
jgi:hypothetical protein